MRIQPLLTCRPLVCILAALLNLSPGFARADALDNWTTNQVSTNLFQLSHVVYGNGRYVAAGGYSDGGTILSSEDGLNWTLRADGGGHSSPTLVWGLTYGRGRFVTVGHFGGTASSTDGVNWTYGYANSVGLYGVTYGNGSYVAVGDGIFGNTSNSIFTSLNGTNWTPEQRVPNEIRDVYDVASIPGVFLAVAAGGYAYVNQSGSWIRINMPASGRTISYYPSYPSGRFVVPIGPGTNLVAAGHYVWRMEYTGLPYTLGKASFVNGFYVARAGPYLATSPDGTNWSLRTSSVLPGTSDIASDGRRLVTVGAEPGSSTLTYKAFTYVSDPLMTIGVTNGPPLQIILSGVEGRSYRVEYLPSLPASATNPWQTLTNLVLPSSPYLLADPEAPSAGQRYYRAVLLP